MELIISPGGTIRCIYGEEMDLAALGGVCISRASHVEPDPAGAWWADLTPIEGPKLGPFPRRGLAFQAEIDWLSRKWLNQEVT